MLKRDQFDLAILRGHYDWNEETFPISVEPMCLVCSHENAGKPLDQYPYIRRHTDLDQAGQINQWLNRHGLSHLSSTLRIDNIDTCKEMARYGLGWCILPQICLSDFDGHVQELTLENGEPFTRSTYALCRSNYSRLPQVELFLNLLTDLA